MPCPLPLAPIPALPGRRHLVQDSQVVIQQFCESRISAIERYVAFCVMFHAMAAASCRPLFRRGWDVARSQSNLRVATTASPVLSSDAVDEEDSQLDVAAFVALSLIGFRLRGFVNYF